MWICPKRRPKFISARLQVPIYEGIGLTCRGERTVPSPWINWKVWFFSKETKAIAERAPVAGSAQGEAISKCEQGMCGSRD